MFDPRTVMWIGEGKNDQKRTETRIIDNLPRLSKISLDNRDKSKIKLSRCTCLGDFYFHAKFQVIWTCISKVILIKRNEKI